MRGRREKHNIIGRGRCVHSFIQNNFVITKPSVFAPLQTSSCCYCGKRSTVGSYDVHRWKKWFRMLWFKAKGPVHSFLQLTLSVLIYSAQVDALVMWSRGQRSQSTQSKTRLCTNVFRRQTLGNGYSLFIISLQTKPTFLFKAEISPHSVNWVS